MNGLPFKTILAKVLYLGSVSLASSWASISPFRMKSSSPAATALALASPWIDNAVISLAVSTRVAPNSS